MKEALFVPLGIAVTILCWGAYGPVLHKGQTGLEGDRLKPLICVGIAYFVVAIIVPVLILSTRGELGGGWHFSGAVWSMAAGAAGTLGALGIILALTSGGRPVYVMPLVFGGAPIINVFVSIYFAKIPWKSVHPIFYSGMIMVAIGAALVLVFQPRPTKPHVAKPVAHQKAEQTAPSDASESVPPKETTT